MKGPAGLVFVGRRKGQNAAVVAHRLADVAQPALSVVAAQHLVKNSVGGHSGLGQICANAGELWRSVATYQAIALKYAFNEARNFVFRRKRTGQSIQGWRVLSVRRNKPKGIGVGLKLGVDCEALLGGQHRALNAQHRQGIVDLGGRHSWKKVAALHQTQQLIHLKQFGLYRGAVGLGLGLAQAQAAFAGRGVFRGQVLDGLKVKQVSSLGRVQHRESRNLVRLFRAHLRKEQHLLNARLVGQKHR